MNIAEQIKNLFNQLTKEEQDQLVVELENRNQPAPFAFQANIDKCPHCQSEKLIKFGKCKSGHRFRCNVCHKTFTSGTGTMMYHIKKKDKLVEYGEILKKEGILPIATMAKKLGISIPTAFEWRHKILLSIPKKKAKFEGEAQMDDIWVLYSQKGRKGLEFSRKRGGSKRQGDNDFQVKLLTATDKNQIEMKVARIGRITKNDIVHAVGDKFKASQKLVTDGHHSYKSFAKEAKLEHVSFLAKEHKAETGENVQYLNNIACRFKNQINRTLHGVSTKYLQLYANWFAYCEFEEIDILHDKLMTNTNVWDIHSNVEKMYQKFIETKSVRTYRCPTKRTRKSQNWNSEVIDLYSYI